MFVKKYVLITNMNKYAYDAFCMYVFAIIIIVHAFFLIYSNIHLR